MPIKNYTTKIDVFESLGEIQGALARNGARKIMVDYDDRGRPVGITFGLQTAQGGMLFQLPANTPGVMAAFERQKIRPDAEQAEKADEIGKYRFYYCESEDEYLIGARLDTFYYARWDGSGFTWSMSRYLPWGQHVVAPETAWKEYTYPSEPKEIGISEWFKGFLGKLTREAAEAALEERERAK